MRVQSYNGGTILKITNQGASFFWDVNARMRIPSGSSKLIGLLRDILTIGCARVCVLDCPPFALTSNSGVCLASNAGVVLGSNQAV